MNLRRRKPMPARHRVSGIHPYFRRRRFRADPVGLLQVLFVLAVIALALLAAPISAQNDNARPLNADAIAVPDGYRIEPLVANLSVPTTAIFDGNDLLVAESGWANTAPARILRIKTDWQVEVVAQDGLQGPVTGLALINGSLYVSHKDKVSVVEPGGKLRDIVTGLPSDGDHQNNNLVQGADGKVYLAQGTTTNSAVVGEDNYIFGWLEKSPGTHELPCKDITLVGQNFETGNPLTPDQNDKAVTGAYKPFGTPTTPGEVIKGDVRCGGSILRFNPDGSGLEVYAWGLRNPFGLDVDRSGQLWAVYHGADVRGSRNIFNDPDYLVKVEKDAWYGWPEYFDDKPASDPSLKDPSKEQPQFLWKDHPPLSHAFAKFTTHSGANGLTFSPGGAFGFEGDGFIAEFGVYLPITTGVNIRPAGFDVVRVDMKTGKVEGFAANKLPGPHYINRAGGFDRPSDLVFGPDQSLYVVDWGSSTIGLAGLKLVPLTGAIWRIYKADTQKPMRPEGALGITPPPQIPEPQRQTEVRNVPEVYQMLAGPVGIVIALVLIVVLGAIIFFRRVT